jgi:hypothetical protein
VKKEEVMMRMMIFSFSFMICETHPTTSPTPHINFSNLKTTQLSNPKRKPYSNKTNNFLKENYHPMPTTN